MRQTGLNKCMSEIDLDKKLLEVISALNCNLNECFESQVLGRVFYYVQAVCLALETHLKDNDISFAEKEIEKFYICLSKLPSFSAKDIAPKTPYSPNRSDVLQVVQNFSSEDEIRSYFDRNSDKCIYDSPTIVYFFFMIEELCRTIWCEYDSITARTLSKALDYYSNSLKFSCPELYEKLSSAINVLDCNLDKYFENKVLTKIFSDFLHIVSLLRNKEESVAERKIACFYSELANMPLILKQDFNSLRPHNLTYSAKAIDIFSSIEKLSECGEIRSFYDDECKDLPYANNSYNSSTIFNFFSMFEEFCYDLKIRDYKGALAILTDYSTEYRMKCDKNNITISYSRNTTENDNFAYLIALKSGDNAFIVDGSDDMLLGGFYETVEKVSNYLLNGNKEKAIETLKNYR